MITIRPSTEADIHAITHIYTHHVQHGTGTFETTAPSVEEMAQRRADVLSKGLPYLVVEETQQAQGTQTAPASPAILGYAYCNWFKPRPAYRYSAEDSIYLAPHAIGRGLGRLLLLELMAQSERAGIRKLIAVIGDANNHGSIALHRSSGFSQVGVLASCGWKFGRWLDVVLMERTLGLGDTCPPEEPSPHTNAP